MQLGRPSQHQQRNENFFATENSFIVEGPQRHPQRRDELRLFPGQRAELLSYGDGGEDDDDDRGHEADMDDTSIDSRASSMMGMADSIDSMNVG